MEPPHVAQQSRRDKLRNVYAPPAMLDSSAAQAGGLRKIPAGYDCVGVRDLTCYPALQHVANLNDESGNDLRVVGSFTGYAAIIKRSEFLKPAQQLLDELCSVVTDSSCVAAGVGSSERGGNSVGSPSCSFYGSAEAGGDRAGRVHRPEFQQKKAKLLYLQEEVCRRYKQYHQQMQMVVSSFESIVGLCAATPYTSLALKVVSKHFRCLKNAISDQLRHISKLLGEEYFASSPGSSIGNPITNSKQKFIGQSLRRLRTSDNGSSFLNHTRPVWRPQRGLPERAVSVLRAWLFEHFLHPYPTDTDKHILASQTGLSRNQVSNWFINARVRLWKPMVEEIHMLEVDLNSANKNDNTESANHLNNGLQPSSDQRSQGQSSKPFNCSFIGSVPDEECYRTDTGHWHQEKRSRIGEDCMVPVGVDGGLMSIAYQGGMGLRRLGAVSLTLGLRHNDGANVVRQQQQQQQMRGHFEGQIFHGFVD